MSQPLTPPPPPPPPPIVPVAARPAREQVNGPAMGLMITAGIGGLFQVAGLAMNVLGVSMSTLPGAGGGGDDQFIAMLSGTVGVVFNILGLAIAGLIFFAALRMRELRGWGLGLTASILAMVPCLSPCCLLGLPIGIWALVVLLKPEVKGAFTA